MKARLCYAEDRLSAPDAAETVKGDFPARAAIGLAQHIAFSQLMRDAGGLLEQNRAGVPVPEVVDPRHLHGRIMPHRAAVAVQLHGKSVLLGKMPGKNQTILPAPLGDLLCEGLIKQVAHQFPKAPAKLFKASFLQNQQI